MNLAPPLSVTVFPGKFARFWLVLVCVILFVFKCESLSLFLMCATFIFNMRNLTSWSRPSLPSAGRGVSRV